MYFIQSYFTISREIFIPHVTLYPNSPYCEGGHCRYLASLLAHPTGMGEAGARESGGPAGGSRVSGKEGRHQCHGPDGALPGWVETLTGIARDEAAHLAQTVRLLTRRGGRLERGHRSPYAQALRILVRKGVTAELLDRLLVSALIEARSCERFALLAASATEIEPDLAAFYKALYSSEMGHYKVFLKLAAKAAGKDAVATRWLQLLTAEARIIGEQAPGPRIHSGF
jgi:tRNA-(ms[2]io[6]A)-hydroxylase